jgi:NADH:ubiquinone oxidoreductase subunit 4 (subunit M)
MLLSSLLIIPIIGIFLIFTNISYAGVEKSSIDLASQNKSYKITAFITSIVNLVVSLVIFILFDFSSNQFQFVQEHYNVNSFDIYLGVDGISIYFILLTTIIMPIAILSN